MNHNQIGALSLDDPATLGLVIAKTGKEEPTQEEIQDAFEAWKVELHAEEEARLAEVERVACIRARWASIADISGAIHEAGRQDGNPALLLEEIIRTKDLVTLELLELKGAVWSAKIAEAARVEAYVRSGAALQSICDQVYYYILGFNRSRNFSTQEGDVMEEKFRPVREALKGGRLDKAYALILGTDPDGKYVTDQMKADALKVIQNALNV